MSLVSPLACCVCVFLLLSCSLFVSPFRWLFFHTGFSESALYLCNISPLVFLPHDSSLYCASATVGSLQVVLCSLLILCSLVQPLYLPCSLSVRCCRPASCHICPACVYASYHCEMVAIVGFVASCLHVCHLLCCVSLCMCCCIAFCVASCMCCGCLCPLVLVP